MTEKQQEWGTRVGVILAVAGSAVGLGNFLRFPGQAAANGGGAFMIPYFAALLFLGIPIGWAEWTMGRYGGRKGFHSSPSIMGVIGRGAVFRYLGIIGVLIPLAVSFYYTYIEAWCLVYSYEYLTGGIGIDRDAPIAEQTRVASEFYDSFTGRKEHGVLAGGSYQTFVFWVITFVVNIWLVYRGHLEGHREVRLLGDAGHGRPRPDRPRLRPHARDARPGEAGPERHQRPWVHVEPELRGALQPADLAGGGGADLLQPLRRLRRDHQLRVLHEEEGRRRALRADRVRDQRAVRGRASAA